MAGFRTTKQTICQCNAKGCKCNRPAKHGWCGECTFGRHIIVTKNEEIKN